MTIFFQKIPKTLFWGHFDQNWGKMNFPGEKGPVSLKYYNYLLSRKKKPIKIKTYSCEKCRPTDDCDFI